MDDENEDGLTEEEIEQGVADFVAELTEHIEELKEQRFLRKSPSASQIEQLKALARKMIEDEDYPDAEKLLLINCPACYDPVLLSHPDHGERAINILLSWNDNEDYGVDYLFLGGGISDNLCIQDLLKKPRANQLAEALKSLPSWRQQGGCDYSENQALLRALVQLYPELIKQTATAQSYFDPTAAAKKKPTAAAKKTRPKGKKKEEGGCLASLVGLAIVVFVIWMIYKALIK
jgi:hypothetical protein